MSDPSDKQVRDLERLPLRMPEQPRFPQTKAEAVAVLPEWEAALVFARSAYDSRRQQARNASDRLERLRGQMAVIRDMVRGEYDQAEQQRYAQGSRGPWPINGYTSAQTKDGGS
jgi:galactokinase